MKPSPSIIASNKGFSLIEIIATLILAGIMAAFFIHFMGTAMNQSWKSVEIVAGEADAEGKIEEIMAYYTSEINGNPESALSNIQSLFGGVATMKYIRYSTTSGVNEADGSGENWTLKVTIEAPGNKLSTILTKSRAASSDPKVNY